MMKHDLVIVIDGNAYHVLKMTMGRNRDVVSLRAAEARVRKYSQMEGVPTPFYVIVKCAKKSQYYYICEKLNLEERVEDA